MNILILCAGRRVKIVQYFNKELAKVNGLVFTCDMDMFAPAVYFSEKFFKVPKINDENYVDDIIKICSDNNIDALISMIDPELELIAGNYEKFKSHGITPIISSLPMVELSFNKYAMHRFLIERGLPSVPTFYDLEQIGAAIGKGNISFPLISKPVTGSASLGITTIKDEYEFENYRESSIQMVYQPFFKDKEFGVDVYVDMVTGELVDLFIKEKISMRAGETDKSISIHNKEIENIVRDFVSQTEFKGPIDIDIFEHNGKFFISEINPRFGGGYPHAYECGIDFPAYIVNNLNGISNAPYTGFGYEKGKIMVKFDDLILL
ncbi:carbamoyl-phosphate synthase large subunit [Planomicrobium soli]|uniref:Carbamoyl-phosphate synthase large subunit n=1 Tax=Planomicrobium soli TaxID=1176648 RepID=A0A2P8GCH6_9BACL|nr:ATP-grasp domain-containing protein [Planomicrobium soli]PSL31680.1 carbamoyl-phosphate synthase large subunit [Planomicrobium soli]